MDLSSATCTYCDSPPVKSIKTPKGGVVTVCSKHLAAAKQRVANTKGPVKKNVGATTDLSNPFDSGTRDRLAEQGAALPDGSYPIRNVQDLKNAIQAIGRARDPAKAKAHIRKRARALGHPELIPTSWGKVDLSEEERDRLAAIIDLALTKDGRKSYKNQGRWGHGFVPLDKAAKKAKAKGSPIAMKRMQRLYGNATKGQPSKPEDKGRTSASDRQNQHNTPIKHKSSEDKKKLGTLKASDAGATERTSTGRVATARRPFMADSKASQRLETAGKNQVEHSKGGGSSARALKPWNEIPEADKVLRNGVRYVKSVYKGQPQLVRWVGAAGKQETSDATKRKLATVSMRDAMNMSTAELRRLLKAGQNDEVAKVLNAALRDKTKKAKPKIKGF